jgi:Domain of unknown function (DUF1905)
MGKERFEAELVEGHKGVTTVLVPFDPEDSWGLKPVKLDPRRDGWLVKGTANGIRLEGYIGYRWGRHFMIIDAELRSAAKVAVGDELAMVVEPTATARALAKAGELSQWTTAPKKGRADAVEPTTVARRGVAGTRTRGRRQSPSR